MPKSGTGSQAAWHTEMAEHLAVGMQIVISQSPHAGPLVSSWALCLLLGKSSHSELPEPAPEAPALLPDSLDEPLSPVFPDETGSLGGLTQTSQGRMRHVLMLFWSLDAVKRKGPGSQTSKPAFPSIC